MGIILALIASINFGVSSFLMKKSYKDFTPAVFLGFFSLFAVIIWSVAAISFGVNTSDLPKAFLYGLIAATFAQGLYMYVIAKGELSITGTILASYPIYTVLASIFILGESITSGQAIFVFLNIVGTLIVSIPQKLNKGDLNNYQYIIWPVVGAAAIGLSDTLSKNVIDTIDLGTYLLALAWAHVPIAIIALALSKEYKNFKLKLGDYKFAITGAIIHSIGTLLLYVSFNYGNASILAPITATYPVLIILLSVTFLKEHLTIKDIIGLIFVFVGIIGVSLA